MIKFGTEGGTISLPISQVSRLSTEAKEAIVLKAINRDGESIASIASAHNIGFSTLTSWLKRYRSGEPLSSKTSQSSILSDLSRREQFQHLVATSGLDEVPLGSYCREHGLYSHQLNQWRESFVTMTDKKSNQNKAELRTLKDKCKQFERELRRKEKALAEASALLVMKKKPT